MLSISESYAFSLDQQSELIELVDRQRELLGMSST